ncbi:MAG TPA: hypothetical protein VF556_06390 [Pyrinomonadaceae bacterium]|jgi:hypothetical protein
MPERFVKSLFIFLLVLIFTPDTSAQTGCGTTETSGLLNLYPGMSPEQTQAVVGKALKIKIKKKGERTFFQNFIENSAPVSLHGVRALYLRFFDLKLYQIEIFYEKRSDWATLESFTAALSAQIGISPALWNYEKVKSVIDCGEFTIVVDNLLNPHVEITDEIVRKQVELERQKKK